MKKAIGFILIILSFHNSSWADSKKIDLLKESVNQNDFLSSRVLLKKMASEGMSFQDWRKVRSLISKHPNIGFDILFAWDRMSAKFANQLSDEDKKVQALILQADQSLQEKRPDQAIEQYQAAAQLVKSQYKTADKIPAENRQSYFYILQQLARSLYQNQNYNESIEVYGWIGQDYYQYRQIQFEKMWAGFKSKRYDLALGSVVSQKSVFFSQYIEPESYLLQFYLYKKLCRETDAQKLLLQMKAYLNRLESNKLQITEWARGDLYTLSLAQLVDSKRYLNTKVNIVSVQDKKNEFELIKKRILQLFNEDSQRLKSSMQKILGYATLIKSGVHTGLSPVKEDWNPQILSEKAQEYWPYKDLEEWTDEVGSLYYIGDSLCIIQK